MMHLYVLAGIITESEHAVLILVVMDDALVLKVKSFCASSNTVLILVVMDDALVRSVKRPLGYENGKS